MCATHLEQQQGADDDVEDVDQRQRQTDETEQQRLVRDVVVVHRLVLVVRYERFGQIDGLVGQQRRERDMWLSDRVEELEQ